MTKPPKSRPIALAVERTYLASLVAGVLVTVIAGTVVSAIVVVAREDSRDQEIARTLHMELSEGAGQDGAGLAAAVDEEMAERAHSERAIEIWRAGESLPAGEPAVFGSWEGRDACGFGEIDGHTQRVCSVPADDFTVVVASPVAPMLEEVAQITGAIALAGLLSLIVALVLGRRALNRKLAPLSRFTTRIAQLPARATRADFGDAASFVDSGVIEIDALASAFHGLIERVADALAREQRFTADAAHELRSPLTRVRAQLELYQRDNPGAVESLAAVIRTVDELARMVEMLLTLARNEAAVEDTVDLGDVVANVLARLAPADAARLRVSVPEATQPLVRGDTMLLELALGNLIDNALKYSTGDVTVSIGGSDPLELAVDDDGPGISYGELPHVLLPFVRGSVRPPSVRGAGIGLALADHVARLHGGGLTLGNRAVGGLRASVTLPAWRPRPR